MFGKPALAVNVELFGDGAAEFVFDYCSHWEAGTERNNAISRRQLDLPRPLRDPHS
jgi:hypothetical protein